MARRWRGGARPARHGVGTARGRARRSRRQRDPVRLADEVTSSADGRLRRMIRVSVFYPSAEGATFDHDYYREKHVPLCIKTWNLDGAEIDKGVDGPYVAAVHFKFD